VLAWERQQGSAILAAYVEPLDPASIPASDELRELVSAELPAFMVPATFTAVDAFPVTPNGKLDRSALPAPDTSHLVEERVEPRTERERTLAAIWQEVLELQEPIGVTEDFFALGGHSLLAVRLLSKVERAFGTKLPLATLFEEGTVEKMAKRVDEHLGEDASIPTLTPLKSTGTRPPLFLFHGHDGELLIYKDLVDAISADQPVYGIQPVGLDGRELPLLSVHDMAAHYVSELRRFAPDGPYLLCGYCFSGVLAYEVAHQLSQHGRPAALLALIDARPLGHRQVPTRVELERAKYRDLREADLRGKARWVARRTKGVGHKIRRKVNFAFYDYISRGGRWVPRSLVDVRWAILRAVQTYRTPSSSAVRVTLLRAADGRVDDQTVRATWATLAEEVVVHEISAPGIQHDNIVRVPYVGLLAAELEAAIEQALAEEAAGRNGRHAEIDHAELAV
jgi:thioesterase domain-containing protein/acyl carrier protein